MSLFERLRWLGRGFHSDSVVLYGLRNGDFHDYLSDYGRFSSASINEPYKVILDNKLAFRGFMGMYVRVPENVCLLTRNRIAPCLDDPRIDGADSLLRYAREHGGIVLKPLASDGGKDILIVRWLDGVWYVNGDKFAEDALRARIRGLTGMVGTEYVTQGEFPASLFADSTNTMRIVTMIDPDTQRAFVPFAAYRIGTRASAPVDNWRRGGISAGIDVETGRMTAGCLCARDGTVMWYDSHPDSGAALAGAEVPGWTNVCNAVRDVADRFPILPLVGWDVLLTHEGFCVIEGNSWMGVGVVQVHSPFLRDPRVRAFYEHHGII